MISGFEITPDHWKQTPQQVRIAATSLQHQRYVLNARLSIFQQQNSELKAKLEQAEQTHYEQRAEIDRLKSKVTELNERLRRTSVNSSLPPSSDSPFQSSLHQRKPSGRMRGAQPGHQGVGRQLLPIVEVSQVIDLYPEQCKVCGSLLLGGDPGASRRQRIELEAGRVFVTEYRRHRLRCLSCRTVNQTEWSTEAAVGTFGASVQAVVAYLTGRLNLSQRDAAEALKELFELKIGLVSISALQRKVSRALCDPETQALVFVRQQASQCADETSWQEESKSNWLWVNSTEKVTVFQIHIGRTQAAAQTIIDENEMGVVTTDRYPGYSFLQGWRRQVCWAHLKRDFTAFAERENCQSKEICEKLLTETNGVFELFDRIRDGTLKHCRLRRLIEPIKERVRKLLEIGSKVENAKTVATCRNILKLYRSLCTIVRVVEVEPTNNRAERALRRAVMWRRKSFGTQSETVSRFVERILSVVKTLGQQSRSVFAYLKIACPAKATKQRATELNLQMV